MRHLAGYPEALATNDPSRAHHALRAFRSPNYRLFFGGQLVSLIGTWMQSVAQAWLVYRLTGSTALLGLVAFCNQIPVLFLASVGGMLADRFPRRRLLVITQVSAMTLAFALAALTLAGHVTLGHVLVLASLLGIVNAIDLPTRQAFVSELVGKQDLLNAIALNSSMVNGARIVGPAIAGVVVAAIGEGWCFFANGVSFVAVISGLLAMRGFAPRPARQRSSALAETAEGFRFVARNPPVLAVLLLLGAVSLLGMPYAVLMPVFANEILGGGARTLGLLMGSSGIGALAAALALAQRRELKGLGRWVMLGSLGFGAALIAFAWSRTFALSAALLAFAGFAMMIQMAGSNTLVQTMTPDALRGRVMAVYSMMFMGMAPLGALAAGAAAGLIGPAATVAAGGAICMVAGVAFGVRLPSLRAGARELIRGAALASGELAQENARDAGAR